MNKKTYGEGTRTERHDREVVAKVVEAKERLRDQLGEGEGVRIENISETEFLWRKVEEASTALCEAQKATALALAAEAAGWQVYRAALNAWSKAKTEEEKHA